MEINTNKVVDVIFHNPEFLAEDIKEQYIDIVNKNTLAEELLWKKRQEVFQLENEILQYNKKLKSLIPLVKEVIYEKKQFKEIHGECNINISNESDARNWK